MGSSACAHQCYSYSYSAAAPAGPGCYSWLQKAAFIGRYGTVQYGTVLQTAHRTTAYTKHGNCRSRVEALSLGPSATQQGGVGNVSVRGARCVVAYDVGDTRT